MEINKFDNHEEWLNKFSKTRRGKMFNLKNDLESSLVVYAKTARPNLYSFMADALWIATKGTKMEEDSRGIIMTVYPDYFKD